ncbi:hypothetical protein E2C01_007789 [Portunus trituberculatus]|uniref:Uncharacterized protein n=1 Tax=Portunus trituberculatus TaxID=210409 RepID=A0A5B7CZ15_PORTR|nr:hypothetical protein [Portunus trituberculatus]
MEVEAVQEEWLCVGASAAGLARRQYIGVCVRGGGIIDDVIVDGGGAGRAVECLVYCYSSDFLAAILLRHDHLRGDKELAAPCK